MKTNFNRIGGISSCFGDRHRFPNKHGFFLWIFLIARAASAMAYGWTSIGDATKVENQSEGVEISAGKAKVRVTVIADGVFRVRLAPNGKFGQRRSWAILEKPTQPQFKITNGKNLLTIEAGGVSAVISKFPVALAFKDGAQTILADDPSQPMAWNGRSVRVWKTIPPDEAYYGLGDKAGPMNRRGRAFDLWNTDQYGWQESTVDQYKAFPFFMGFRPDTGRAYGLFFDNTYRTSFDFGVESRDLLSFGAEGGEMDYYFFAGPDPKTVLRSYTELIGRPPLPPLWGLGYHQSRYSYMTESQAREVVDRFRKHHIPLDGFWFDIDFQDKNYPFTINMQTFPHFEGMVHDFRNMGVRPIVITDMHIAMSKGYKPYDSGMAIDGFIKNADGSLYVGEVWPGKSVFPDFTLRRARDWWGGLYAEFVAMGVSGFWNDMNEPAIFKTPSKTMPLDVRHRLDNGSTTDHREIHNIYGLLNAWATYEGLLRLRPNERPFVLTRAAYPGSHRYAATWTGDNSSTWNHLATSIPQLLSLGISGYGFAGADAGGFIGGPSPELLTQWTKVASMTPFFRNHSAKDTPMREPWVDGPKHERIRRQAIEHRYALMPYLYTSMEEMTRTGIPLLRPIFLEYPLSKSENDRNFLVGKDLFIAPATSDIQAPEEVRLPPGDWYEEESSIIHHGNGEKPLLLHPDLDKLPVFVRAGAIIPKQTAVQNMEETPQGPIELEIYPGPECKGTLYQDDGHSFEYRDGKFLRVAYSCKASDGEIKISSKIEQNNFQPWWTDAHLTIFGIKSKPRTIRLGNQAVPSWTFDKASGSITLSIAKALSDWNILISY